MQNPTTDQARILVLGATGGTGRLIVSQAVARGYDVTVLVRSAEKAADLKGAKVVFGDARDEATLRMALKGRDAVVSPLGTPVSPFGEVTLLSAATRALVNTLSRGPASRGNQRPAGKRQRMKQNRPRCSLGARAYQRIRDPSHLDLPTSETSRPGCLFEGFLSERCRGVSWPWHTLSHIGEHFSSMRNQPSSLGIGACAKNPAAHRR